MSFGVSIGDILKIIEIATRVYKNCRDCPGEYKTLTNEALNLRVLLEDIADKYDAIPAGKKQQLANVFDTCVELLEELDKILLHYNGLDSKSKRAWDRLKWDEQRSRALREKLTSSVVMLNTFYTSLIHDNQVLILEALGRLEKDYRGGHREGSLSSIATSLGGEDDPDEDAAWPQIIRDLEDVGVSTQDVEDYRDFIVDWFVKAVNEGRLMEERTELPSPVKFPQALNDRYPDPVNDNMKGMPSCKTPRFPPPVSKSELLTSSAPTMVDLSSPLYMAESGLASLAIAPKEHTPHIYDAPQPSLGREGSASGGSLISTAQQIVAAWNKREFATAERLLESQLAAVERGESVTTGQPDRRVLLHLIGVSASYSGNFLKAKSLFQQAFNGIYLSGGNIDDGDIAAARWLGDACLHLNEPHNTAFAWGVALEGLAARHGTVNNITWRLYEELDLLNRLLQSLNMIAHSFQRNFDSTDIFLNSHAKEKSSLMTSVMSRMKGIGPCVSFNAPAANFGAMTIATDLQSPRPRTDSNFAETYLVEPLVSSTTFPLPWDDTFSPIDAILIQRNMSNHWQGNQYNGTPDIRSFVDYTPTVSLMHAKHMHYITKRDIKWLADTVEAGLKEMGIEYNRSRGAILLCRLNQRSGNFAYFECVGIKFRKVQFRNLYGLKVTQVLWATRGVPRQGNGFQSVEPRRGTEGFRDIVKGIVQKAEDEENMMQTPLKSKSSWKTSMSRSSTQVASETGV